MNGRKLASLAVIAFLAFYAVTNPSTAADVVGTVFDGIGAFATHLANR